MAKNITIVLFLFTALSYAIEPQPLWQKDKFKIFLKNNELELFRGNSRIVHIQSLAFNFIEPDTIFVEDVKADTVTLTLRFGETDGFHDDFPSRILLTISHCNNTFHFSAADKSFNHVVIRLKDFNEHYFGLIEKLYPHNAKDPDLRGNAVDVEVYGYGNLDYAENYASAYSAFYISSAGYGSFFDTFAKGRYQFAIDGVTEIYHQTSALDWYLFVGDDGAAIHKEYFNNIGKPKQVPLWACGPIFWRDQNNGGKDELLDDIQKFTDLKIPLTACFIDRPYSNGANEWSKMDFNKKFSNPQQWIKKINDDYGLQLMTWIGPMTFADTAFPGRFPLDPGYIDLTNPAAVKEFERRLSTNQYLAGVKGHKMDRADENFPVAAKWYDPVSESESRNKYIFLFSKVIDSFLTKAHGKDQFNFARAAFHRSQPYLSALWGGDSRNNWQGMAGNQANAMRCGFMGFPMWGSDVGGYLGEGRIDEELYIRWLQWGAWSGMFETKIDGAGGSGEDRPPWKYSQRLQSIFRNVCNVRMELLPYIYSCINTSYNNGVMMKPLAYNYPSDSNTYHIWDEYIFGDAFLVAPVFSKENSREIYLPEGTWYDVNNLQNEYHGPMALSKNVPLDTIPVFVKGNSIYISGKIYQGNSKAWEKNIRGKEEIAIHLFPGKANEQASFSYVDYFDNDTEKNMVLNRQAGAGIITFVSPALSTNSSIMIQLKNKPKKILLNNEPIKFNLNRVNNTVTISVSKNTTINLEIL